MLLGRKRLRERGFCVRIFLLSRAAGELLPAAVRGDTAQKKRGEGEGGDAVGDFRVV